MRVLKNINLICIIADLPKNIENFVYLKKVVNKRGWQYTIQNSHENNRIKTVDNSKANMR